ncbi:conjugative transposon TraK protein [Chitinophaga terrae (ex Kim and Jung 2007)]|uniref:conjugative transposon protein TraK n=1 Tax=Chitinophaga terrae (ex Kim and Jung 2007) TaxID=408074 RepID=UPI00278B86BB|nr:conjugative transposon protein TraK [Chitinophaga terrae (ex Kim and Jung 2007)]MDQ0107461.1 conjugative transposon TraK protein [Chitinophaga terrae (ex Kim and Jung 2007)]
MLKQIKNVDSAFRHVKLFSIVIIGCITVFGCFIGLKAFEAVTHAQSRIYILYNGNVLEAISADRRHYLPAEARHHVRMFHEYFFNLVPDEKVIERNINKALHLADQSAKAKYEDLKEAGYYNGIISGNVTQEITPDSVVVNTEEPPYHFKYYGKIKITRATIIVTRNLVSEGWLRPTKASDDNEHGFLIEKWNILNNTDIKTENR